MASNAPELSVIVCTHNRSDLLEATVRSLVQDGEHFTGLEIVVVDNGSTDGTRDAVADMRAAGAPIMYVHEPRIGLSHARNAGLRASSAPLVAYLDDDVRVLEGWRAAVLSAFREGAPPPEAIGGRVLLDWNDRLPDWLPARFLPVYSVLDYGDDGRFLSPVEHLVGANMAFQRHALSTVGGFDPELGRKGATLMSGEEAAVIGRMRQLGYSVWYEPRASVLHAVVAERRRRVWLWRRMYWDGASQPGIDYPARMNRLFYLLQTLYDLRRLGELSVAVSLATLSLQTQRRRVAWLLLLQRFGRFSADFRMLVT